MKRNDRIAVPMTIEWHEKKHTRMHFLRHLIEKNKCKTMAEVGVRRGGTLFFLLDHIQDLKIYAIDTDIKQFYSEEVQTRYGDRLIPLNMRSDVAADKIADKSLDIVFIDADHSYDSVKTDIIKYTPKLAKHGLLTGHDIDYPGVNRAVKELIKDFDVGPNNVWVRR